MAAEGAGAHDQGSRDAEAPDATKPTSEPGAEIVSSVKAGEMKESEKLPKLFGRFDVAPEALWRGLVNAYMFVFLVNTVADAAYLSTMDARFPAGLEGHYPSESERLASVSYTRQMVAVSMLHRTCGFLLAMALVYFKLYTRVDAWLRQIAAKLGEWYENGSSAASERMGGCGACLCAPFHCLGRFFSWLWSRCCCCCCCAGGRCLERHSAKELLLGSVYLAIISTCFFVVAAPFAYWSQMIDLQFGFANALTVKLGSFQHTFVAGFWKTLVWGIPGKFVFLAVLQFRFGWLFMWTMMIIGLVIVQFNFALIAPAVVGATNPFPAATFAVGRGFPLANTGNKVQPLVSLNRIYFNASEDGSQLLFATKDKSPGQLVLRLDDARSLVIAARPPVMQAKPKPPPAVLASLESHVHRLRAGIQAQRGRGGGGGDLSTDVDDEADRVHKLQTALVAAQHSGSEAAVSAEPMVFAHSANPSPSGLDAHGLLENIGEQNWSVGDHATRVGTRDGKALRDKVLTWAKERDIKISEIYFIDGSHKDARANAFVGGIGNSIIGLYDTLFLGAHAHDLGQDEDDDTVASHILMHADAGIRALSNLIEGLDASQQAESEEKAWSSAPTQAMTDDEIVAILAHELAHADLGHLHQGMFVSAFTSLATFAALGWAAHSPVLAAAMLLPMPLVHVGACVDDHLTGPPLNFVLSFFSDWITRKNEYEADAYVARLSPKYGSALQTSLMKLTVNSNQDPSMPVWYEALRTDHPTSAHRWANIEAEMKSAHP